MSCTCSEPERLRLEGSQAGSHAKACTYVLLGSKGGKKKQEKEMLAGPLGHACTGHQMQMEKVCVVNPPNSQLRGSSGS